MLRDKTGDHTPGCQQLSRQGAGNRTGSQRNTGNYQGNLGLPGIVVGMRDLVLVLSKVKVSIVEIFVVIAIVGMLFALMLPAVQSAREAGRRATAMNDLPSTRARLRERETSSGIARVSRIARHRARPRPRVVPGDASLAARTDHRRPGPGQARPRSGRLDHHLAALGQRRRGRRDNSAATRRRSACSSRSSSI